MRKIKLFTKFKNESLSSEDYLKSFVLKISQEFAKSLPIPNKQQQKESNSEHEEEQELQFLLQDNEEEEDESEQQKEESHDTSKSSSENSPAKKSTTATSTVIASKTEEEQLPKPAVKVYKLPNIIKSPTKSGSEKPKQLAKVEVELNIRPSDPPITSHKEILNINSSDMYVDDDDEQHIEDSDIFDGKVIFSK